MHAWTTQKSKWPIEAPDEADHLTVQIAHVSSKLSALSYLMYTEGTSIERQKEFQLLESEKLELMKLKVRDRLELCMKHQMDSAYSKQFGTLYTWTKKLLSRNGFLDNMKDEKTPEEIQRELDACDMTFTNEDPDYKPDLTAFRNVTPDRKYNLDSWNPNNPDGDILADYISKKKKIDKFYRCHASSLSSPIFILLKLIEKSDYFPKILRNSKLTILPSRFIFSLEALPKIIESILAIEFNNCLNTHYLENGDPHQMAYEPERGTTSCNAITYTHVDFNVSNNKPCLQSFVDVRKAFNVMDRETMLTEAQKIAGAGELCSTRFDGRTYTAPNGERRGGGHNRGVDAGCPIPVFCFKTGINTDVSLTGLNKELDWASLYSDDRSALSSCANILQRALNMSTTWAKKRSILYHDGISCCLKNGVSECKKFPAILVYVKKGMNVPDEFYDLKLEEVPFKLTHFQRNLGLNVHTVAANKEHKSLLNLYGYYFRPEIDRIKSLAYRLQDIKFDFVPQFLRMMILCYFCGVINFSACLYWCRSSKKDMDRLRYYYAMGLSAVIGETTMGTLGASCCKSMTVSEDSIRMKTLRKIIGVKSLREIAMTDAIATIKQVHKIRPEWFMRNAEKRKRGQVTRFGTNINSSKQFVNEHEMITKAKLPTKLSEEVVRSNALIGDIWRLACEKVIDDSLQPPRIKTVHKFEELWFLAEETCKLANPNCKVNEITLTYHTLCR